MYRLFWFELFEMFTGMLLCNCTQICFCFSSAAFTCRTTNIYCFITHLRTYIFGKCIPDKYAEIEGIKSTGQADLFLLKLFILDNPKIATSSEVTSSSSLVITWLLFIVYLTQRECINRENGPQIRERAVCLHLCRFHRQDNLETMSPGAAGASTTTARFSLGSRDW